MLSTTEKKARLFRARLGGYPLWVAWQVTYRCNFRCGFCGYWDTPEGREPEQTLDDFEYGSRQLARLGSMLVSLAGGEPLLRDDIVEVARHVGRWHLPFITTNGYLATPDLVNDLYRAGLWGISVSIDYSDRDRHDRRRGVKGAFDRAIEALEYGARARRRSWQRLNVLAVLMHDNIDEMERLARLAAEYKAYFMVQLYCPLKTGENLFVTRENGVAERMLDLRRKFPNVLSNPYFLGRFDDALNGGVPGCRAGKAFFNIDSKGGVAICVERRSEPVGNLYKNDIISMMQRMQAISKTNRCQRCWYNCRGEVESLYRPYGLLRSLPTYLFDRGRAPHQAPPLASEMVVMRS